MRAIVSVHSNYAETQQWNDPGISYFKYFELSVYFTDIVFYKLHSITLYESKSSFTLIKYVDQILVRATFRKAVDRIYYVLRIARSIYKSHTTR